MCCREREGEEEGELAAPATEGPVCDPLTKLHALSWRFSVDTDQEDSEGPATLTPNLFGTSGDRFSTDQRWAVWVVSARFPLVSFIVHFMSIGYISSSTDRQASDPQGWAPAPE